MALLRNQFVLCFTVVALSLVFLLPGTSFAQRWRIETVDTDNLGHLTSLALDSNGHPVIAYHRNWAELRLARWNGSSWDIEVVDLSGTQAASLTLDGNGYPAISYRDYANRDLKFARWNGSTWDIEVVDGDSDDDGEFNCLKLDRRGYPAIAYSDGTNESVKYARWNGTSWDVEVLASASGWLIDVSLVLDSNDDPAISYSTTWPDKLWFMHWNGSAWDRTLVDEPHPCSNCMSMALDSNEYPVIAYNDIPLGDWNRKLARWNGSVWNVEALDFEGAPQSMVLDTSDYPAISYFGLPNLDLVFARWNGSTWDIETVDSDGNVGSSSSLRLDNHGWPAISYIDASSNGDLKFARYGGLPVDINIRSVTVIRDECPTGGPGHLDGEAEPGEHVTIRVELINDGAEDANGLTSVLSSTEVTVTQDTGALALPLASGQFADLSPDFEFDVPLTVACGQTLDLTLDLTYNGTGTERETFTIDVPDPCDICDPALPATVFRGCVDTRAVSDWRTISLPLTEGNDDETPPFPMGTPIPGEAYDDNLPCQIGNSDLRLYRVLLGGTVYAGNILRVEKVPTGVKLSF